MLKILFVSPHPDDETLGAGGTILKYKNEGHKVYWLNITNMKEEYGYSNELVSNRNKELSKVKSLYDFDGCYNLELEPANLDRYPKGLLITKISEIFNELKPNIIFIPFRNDIHSDHKVVFDSIFACTKSFRYPYIKKVFAMEIPSETDFASYQGGFLPNYFINISDYLEKKINIMRVYENELGQHPFPRSDKNISALATLRGATSGYNYAEAFILIKGAED